VKEKEKGRFGGREKDWMGRVIGDDFGDFLGWFKCRIFKILMINVFFFSLII